MARDLHVSSPTVFAAFSVAMVVSAVVGPYAGRAIDRHGGRWVLGITNVVFATGLVLLAKASGVLGLFGAWIVVGIAMGAGLYEAAFSSLVRIYGLRASPLITGVTLIAGFASTVGWPFSALLQAHLGWRGACLVWAGIHLFIALPLNATIPAHATGEEEAAAHHDDPQPSPRGGGESRERRTAILLAYVFAVAWFVSTAMATHLPRVLQEMGATATGALAAAALVGPAQVAARLVEYGVLRRTHPLLSARLATVAHPLGAAIVLTVGAAASPVLAIFHGAGNGILTIAKGTLPLVLFGPDGYGRRQGILMGPARVAQALAPWAFGLAIDRGGARALWVSSALSASALVALMMVSIPSVEKRHAAPLT